MQRLQQWKIGAGVKWWMVGDVFGGKWWMVWISGKYCGLVVNKFGQNVLCYYCSDLEYPLFRKAR